VSGCRVAAVGAWRGAGTGTFARPWGDDTPSTDYLRALDEDDAGRIRVRCATAPTHRRLYDRVAGRPGVIGWDITIYNPDLGSRLE